MRDVALLIFLAAFSFAQSTDSRPKFEVASIRIYPRGTAVASGAQGAAISPDGVRLTHVTLRGCLQGAYNIVDVEGPDWIVTESYDITAKAAGPASAEQMNEMMQTLLEERFHLKLRRETRQLVTGVLAVTKSGVKNLQAVDQTGRPEMRREDGKLYLKNIDMAFLAGVMASPLGKMPLEKVVDDTGLLGRYNVTLDFTGFEPGEYREYREMRDALFDFTSHALEKDYGLKLERRKMPVQFLIVEGGNPIPTDN